MTANLPSKSIQHAADADNALEAFKGAMRAILEESPEILTGTLGKIFPPAVVVIKLFHAKGKGTFLKELMTQLEGLRKAGQIREDYLKSEEAWACFSDLLDFIDKTTPDPKRYRAIQTAFINIQRTGSSGHDAPYAQQILRVIYELSAGEIVALAAIYNMGSGGSVPVATWRTDVANKSGLLRSELVEEIEASLEKKRLIHARQPAGSSYAPSQIVTWGQRNRLTTLGQEICERIMQPAKA